MARRRRRGFTPFRPPTRPPAGTYDPAFDAQERAAQRGFGDLGFDIQRARERDQSDLFLGQGDITRGRDESLHDLLTDRQRRYDDWVQAQNRAREDKDRSIAETSRRYGILGQQQTSAATAAGAGLSGAIAAARARRSANNLREEQAIDLQFNRFNEDVDRDRNRFMQDSAEREARIGQGSQSMLDRLGLGYQRGEEDRSTQYGRAGRELGFLGQDLSEARFAQAALSGYIPPQPPANEFTRRGVTYQRLGGGRYLLPSGRRVSIRGLRRMYR